MGCLKNLILVLLVMFLTGCASIVSQQEYEECIWGTSIAGTVAGGAVGNIPGAAAGTAGGAAIGAFACGSVGQAPAIEAHQEAPKPVDPDSDGDGVPDVADLCHDTPAGVEVDNGGCGIDSDLDTVADYRDECPGTARGIRVNLQGCPKKGEVLLTLRNIRFAFDSSTLTSESKLILDQAVRVLLEEGNTNIDVNIEGHTDSMGSESYNLGLSQTRAEVVKNYLVEQGVSASRLYPVGKGESFPIDSNDTGEGRQQNRRVEFIVR